MDAENEPVVPAAVLHVPPVVGLLDVDQQTPRPVIVAPPSEDTLPFPVAVFDVIEDAADVVTVGDDGEATPSP
jgi:hypothetical protein